MLADRYGMLRRHDLIRLPPRERLDSRRARILICGCLPWRNVEIGVCALFNQPIFTNAH
jgi:hypothetical protein